MTTTTESIQRSSTPPVSSHATAKRAEVSFAALGGGSAAGLAAGLATPTAGLGDPFAEIFARMATAEPAADPAPVNSESNTEPKRDVDDDQPVAKSKSDLDQPVDSAVAIAIQSNEQEEVVIESEAGTEAELTDREASSQRSDEVALQKEATETNETDSADQFDTELESIDALTPVAPETDVETEAEAVVSSDVAVASNASDDRRQKSVVENADSTESVESTGETRQEATDAVDPKSDAESKPETESRANDTTGPVDDGRRTERRRYSGDHRNAAANPSGEPSVQTNGESSQSGGFKINPSLSDASGSEAIPAAELNRLAEQANANKPTAATAIGTVATAATVAASTASQTAAAAKPGVNGVTSVNQTTTNSLAEPATTTTPKANEATTKGIGPSGADQASAVQRAKLVQRVSRGFQSLGTDGGHIRLRLSPHELGSVRLDIQVQENNVRGRMVTESEAASQLLREHLPQLRSQLESQGIRLESIEITTDASGSFEFDGFENGFSDGRRQQEENRDSDRDRVQSREMEPSAATPIEALAPTSRLPSIASGVDLRV